MISEFYKYMGSPDDEVKSNTIFTIGIMCSLSANCLQQFYPQVISDIFEILKTEKCKQTLDNICGTLCRLFSASVSANQQSIDYELVRNKLF